MEEARATAVADAKSKRRVRFRGSHYIEYDAEQAPVVRLCGAQRRLYAAGDSSVSGGDASSAMSVELLAALRLECEARGIAIERADGDLSVLQHTLRREYARELRSALQERGFISTTATQLIGDDEDIVTLERQLQVAELLLTQVALLSSTEALSAVDTAELSAQTLTRLQLAKKEIEGQADEGYAFGRRFYSIESFINTLEYEELVEIAQNRGIAIPDIPEAEKKEITVVERELCAKYSTSGEGKPLKQLTLRELMVEAHARELIVVKDSRDKNGKRSKKGLIEKLRPVMRQEVLEEKILDKRDDLLRLLLLDVLEKEAAEDRSRALLELMQQHIKRLEPTQGVSKKGTSESLVESSSCSEAMDVDGNSKQPVADAGMNDDVKDQLHHCFSLLTRLQSSEGAHHDAS